MVLDNIKQLANDDMQAVNRLIVGQLSSGVPLINQLSSYLIDSGGKRLRPLLAILAAKCFDYQGTAHISLAAIIEFIHTATLLHDDVVDDSLLRRGRATANALFGNPASVLVGDFLYSRAFQMMASLGDMRVMEILADATNRIAEGEVMQLVQCGNVNITQADYFRVIEHKTAKLFEAAASLGAAICNRSDAEIEVMRQYGSHVGTAFQLVDDALDYSSEAYTLGKNIGDDLAEGKVTLPLIHIMQTGTPVQRNLVIEAIESEDHIAYLHPIQTAIIATDAIDYTLTTAAHYASLATNILVDYIPESPYRDALIGLATFAVSRTA